MSKFNISFNVDLQHIAPELGNDLTPEIVEEVFRNFLLEPAKKQAKAELHEAQKEIATVEDKRAKMESKLRRIMLGIMAECNTEVRAIPADTPIKTEMPFEKA